MTMVLKKHVILLRIYTKLHPKKFVPRYFLKEKVTKEKEIYLISEVPLSTFF